MHVVSVLILLGAFAWQRRVHRLPPDLAGGLEMQHVSVDRDEVDPCLAGFHASLSHPATNSPSRGAAVVTRGLVTTSRKTVSESNAPEAGIDRQLLPLTAR